MRGELQRAYPGEVILSEEDSEEQRRAMFLPNFTGFILDPIDGTYNFKRDMRESAISIGYIKDGEPVAGVVYDPYKDELFEAQSGQGALRNGQTICVSAADRRTSPGRLCRAASVISSMERAKRLPVIAIELVRRMVV